MQAVNGARIEKLINGLKEFGKNPEGKGTTRLAYTKEDKEAENWLINEVKDLKLEVFYDAVGNCFFRRKGKDSTLPPVAMGSHTDTVIEGGAYDGITGVVGALEALYMLQDEELARDVEVIIFRCEESSRFGFGTMGSKFLAGMVDIDKLAASPRKGEKSFKEALKDWGLDPSKYMEAQKPKDCYKCFLEMHIEQGKVLSAAGEQIGVVENIAAPTRFKLIVSGSADHSGATPMGLRQDALVAAAKLVLALQLAAAKEKDHGSVATVGIVQVEPGSINVIPGKAVLWVDVRGVEEASIQRVMSDINKAMEDVIESDNVDITMELLTAEIPVPLDKNLAKDFGAICKAKGIKFRYMNSGAGHDAMNMAKIVPSSMLFVPCKDGVSHNPKEFAKIEDICIGVEVLAQMVKKEAGK